MNGQHTWFGSAFRALTGYSPLRWQERLFSLLSSGQVPTSCHLPTGLGKTAVIPIWLVALAVRADERPVGLPRRLAYVVNRRTVVDQATAIVERMRERLRAPEDSRWAQHAATLRELAGRLRSLAAFPGEPLAVSTLRGELADNEEWKTDPARAAVIIGTIDMVGSKLLFSGYGDGRYNRAHHAGLIGQDVLIVHDEAHLTPAFSDLLARVAGIQAQDAEPCPLRVMELSATLREGGGTTVQLEPEDERDAFVAARLCAKKRLRLHPPASGRNELTAALAELALQHEGARARVLIYVRSPDDAQRVQRALARTLAAEARERVSLVTGTIRGYERDQLVRADRVFRALLSPGIPVEQTVYLVSTSAGEVGIDLDADHMVCDLTTLDAMIQRLGRVNRSGGDGRTARVDVVALGDAGSERVSKGLERAMQVTRETLARWGAESNTGTDVGPGVLRDRLARLGPEETRRSFSPTPIVPPLTDILLDAWSLTSVTDAMPGRPEVDGYLHGLTADPPESYVAWRKEVKELSQAGDDRDALRRWFRACPIEARERLRDQTDRVRHTLDALLEAHRKGDGTTDFSVISLDERGNAQRTWLSKLVRKEFPLAYRTIVLPVEVGGLNDHGMLDAGAWARPAPDVADRDRTESTNADQRRQRWLRIPAGGGTQYVHLVTGRPGDPEADGLRQIARVVLQAPLEGDEDEAESRDLLLMVSARQAAETDPESTPIYETLSDHTRAVVQCAARIADALGLDRSLKDALVLAAQQHDRGKARPLWQRYARNPNPSVPWAKSPKYDHWRVLGGYRHEFGSLLDVLTDNGLGDRGEVDLVMHLVAAHHGWARPHFDPRAFAPAPTTTAQNNATAAEVLRRFGRLQQRFGRWGLAWLESLLRCADIAASQRSGEMAAEFAPAAPG
jgi:CRISPR-associated endonuclease/helicase Cas3